MRDEKIVESADLVDAGVIFGTGFAPFRGGPLHFAANEQKSNVEVLGARRRSERACQTPASDADDATSSAMVSDPEGLTPSWSRWTRPCGAWR